MTTTGAISFTVFGEAAPAGSKSATVRGGRAFMFDNSKRSRPWKGTVAAAAGHEMTRERGGLLLEGPLFVELVFYRPRPRVHFGTGRNDGVLKTSAPEWPTSKPDVLKLARAVEDAMIGIVYRDDSSIVVERIEKRFGEPARLEVHVSTIDQLQAAASAGGLFAGA